jgi:Fe-S oxidoreductase
MKLVSNCLETGNAYGETVVPEKLAEEIKNHNDKNDTLLLLGVDAIYKAPCQAVKAIKVLEKAGVDFTVLENEAPSGAQLDFLIGAANETKEQMSACAKVLDEYKTVVCYDPNDSKAIKQLYKEYGVDVKANVVTYTSFVADLLRQDKLEPKNSGESVVFQDPYQLSRDLEETEEAREVINAFANLHEMLLNRKETVWAGNILMAEYMPKTIKLVAERRIFNATSIGADTIVTACVSEYVALNNVEQDKVKIISIEDLILG